MKQIYRDLQAYLQKASHQPPFTIAIQSDETECGLASLTMIARSLGTPCDLEALRCLYGSTRGGMTIGELCDLASKIGLEGKPKRASVSELRSEPTILFAKGEHFSVLWKIENQQYFIADPSDGLIILSPDNFDEYYSGIAIAFRRVGNPSVSIRKSAENQHSFNLKSLFLSHQVVVRTMLVLAIVSTVFTLLSAGAQDVFMTYIVEEGEILWTKGLILVTILISVVVATSSLMLQIAVQRQLQEATVNWNVELFESILRAPYTFFVNKSSGLISARLTQVNEALSGYQSSLVMAFTGLLNLSVYLFAVLLVSPPLAVVSLAGIGGFIFVGIRFYGLNIQNNYRLRDAESNVSSGEFKLIGGRNQIVIEGAQEAIERDLSDSYLTLGKAQLDISRVDAFNQFWLGTVDQGLNAFLLICSSILIVNGYITTGTYAAINVIIGTALEPIRSLSTIIETIQNSRLTFDSAAELYQENQGNETMNSEVDDAAHLIEFNEVTYSYSIYSDPIINAATVRIRSKTGKPIAIRLDGESGSGKSTLLNLLMGLIAPTSGTIKVFGIEVASLAHADRRRIIQYIDRSPLIINGSVESNARLGVDCTSDDYKQVIRALGFQEEPLFRLHSNRYLFDESSISTGQGVMINLVRAVLIKPKLLLIDEALVSLPESLHESVVKGLLALDINVLVIQHGNSSMISKMPTLHMSELSDTEVSA